MHYFLSIFLILYVVSPFSTHHKDPKKREKVVLITTNYGDIKVKLYNETPLHRDNFLKLTKGGVYDSLLFHRVINDFMIQGGDPDSKGAKAGKKLGEGTLGYTVPAEFKSGLYHKRGVIAAAREGDNINPEKASSASQFYLVQGRVFTQSELDKLEEKMKNRAFDLALEEYLNNSENDSIRKVYFKAAKRREMVTIDSLNKAIKPLFADKLDAISFNETQRELYTTIGGTPHLDGSYTVFGEIIEGINVVDSIALVQTDRNNRPLEDVVFSITLVK